LRKFLIIILISLVVIPCRSQNTAYGLLTGTVTDENKKPLYGASVQLVACSDSLLYKATTTDKNGFFSIRDIVMGYYKLTISFLGFQSLIIDSIYFRKERFDFNMDDIILKLKTDQNLSEVIIYAEKPLIESKEGNITFNAGESALAAGSTAIELLATLPLITKDPGGKILVRGKEPKILIDDKPVELNLQQLQDLLESMPGSSIEKIEVLTNPPPQYANEQGGVINIITKKGKVGMGGRLTMAAGTRGDRSMNGNFTYRKNKLALTVNAGKGYNRIAGGGYSERKNFYLDSINYFNTLSRYVNKNDRPNLRLNLDYEWKKNQLLNFSINHNQNEFVNQNNTEFKNLNRFEEIYRLSERTVQSEGHNTNSTINLSYTWKGKTAGEQLRVIANTGFSKNENNRHFYQEFFFPDHTPNGLDSTQQQFTDNRSNSFVGRVNYDKPLVPQKTFLSIGTMYNRSNNTVEVNAAYRKKPDGIFVPLDLLSTRFIFHQTITNMRISLKQLFNGRFSLTAGIAAEQTTIHFELLKEGKNAGNGYWNLLPFINLNKNWKDQLHLTFSYRRTIQRPGISQLNPAIDFSDPYNIRFGNYQLAPSLAHNFDIIAGRTHSRYFINLGAGFNLVEDIFSQLRTLLPDGKTQITWENIGNRKEYEISTWNGYTLSQKIKLNFSASFTYNQYSPYDKAVKKFRDGGSFTANLNGNYSAGDRWNFTGNFSSNRFANPQGAVSWNLSMNVGVQRKLLSKKLILTFNFIDPFRNQQTNSFTSGTNFQVQTFSFTQTRNYRLTVAYNFSKTAKKKITLPVKG